MSGLDEMRAIARAAQRGTRCWVTTRTSSLTAEDAATLGQALTDSGIMSSTIATWLDRRGVRVGQQSISRHRRGVCACDRG
jgi:hypothetical protein